MAYISTVDERYGGTATSSSAGSRDAPNYINSDYVLAESSTYNSTAYGTLVYANYSSDTDIYSLGLLSEGTYTIDVDADNWDYYNSDIGSITSISLLDSLGSSLITDYSITSLVYTDDADIEFNVESASTYYLKIVGASYGTTEEYRATYTRTGDLPDSNNSASFSNATYVGTKKAGQDITANIVYSDLDGNSNDVVYTGWAVINEDETTTLLQTTTSSTLTLAASEVGKTLLFNNAFYDDLGNYESSPWYIVGTIVQNDTPVVASAIADATATEDSVYSYDASAHFSDVDGDTLAYTATLSNGNALPVWLDISTNGTLSGTPDNGDVGAIEVTVTATDSSLATASDTFTLSVTNVINGTSGNDTIVATAVDAIVNGGSGTDIFQYSSQYSGHTITQTATGHQIKSASGGTDTLINMEKVQFSDYIVNLTIQNTIKTIGTADLQKLEELYVAFFNRVADADGLEYWIGQFNSGQSINQVAESFYSIGIQYTALTGFSDTMTDTDFINVVYSSVLGRADGAGTEGLDYWTPKLENGTESNGSLVSAILSAAHAYKGDATWGWVADLLDNKISVADTFAVQHGLNFLTPEDSITGGMAIAAAVTEFSTVPAIELIGIVEGVTDFV